ncbi:MAG TPA: thioredoxin [bacterium]|nr:thioredoxin [bacterium]
MKPCEDRKWRKKTMASDYIVDVSETDFQQHVLSYSNKHPVIVDFWAEWCAPCRVLGPILERIAEEAQGDFRLAKVNVDHNPNLAMRYSVRSIPSIKAFRDGKVVSEMVGAQPEPVVRQFISALIPSATDLTLEKGLSMLDMQQWKNAEKALNKVLEDEPTRPGALLGLAKSLIMQGCAEEVKNLLEKLPPSREYASAEALLPLVNAVSHAENNDTISDNPIDAAYDRAIRLIILGNIPAALDGLIEVIRQNKRYRDGEARLVILGLFELLGENNPLTPQYRNELASVWF